MKKIVNVLLALFLAKSIAFCQVLPKDPEKQQSSVKKPISAKKPQFEPAMILVQGGIFRMGCGVDQAEDCRGNDKPVHQVTVSSFKIGKYLVTQAQWQVVVGNYAPVLNKVCENCAVTNVSWIDVQDFINKLNSKTGKDYRLPTEAEWEFSARGGNKSKGFRFSGSNDIKEVSWFENTPTHTVGQKKPNELGLFEMSGVWQWCSDWYGAYSNESQTNPVGPSSGDFRVVRGLQVATRFYFLTPGESDKNTGFRLVLSL